MSDFANKEDHPLDRDAFFAMFKEAYGWTVAFDGEIVGLVAGDMGYEGCGINLGVLAAHAIAAVSSRHEEDKVTEKLAELIAVCHEALSK